MSSSDSLWLTDVAHHHLALGVVCVFLGNTVRAFSLNRDQCGLHWYLALSLAALGTASSFAATHIDAFTVYAYLTKDFTAMSAIYTHHQYIAGFFLLGAFAHGAIYLVRDANLSHLSAITLFLGFHDGSHGYLLLEGFPAHKCRSEDLFYGDAAALTE